MHSVKIHKLITRIISLFYLINMWHRGEKPTPKELKIKYFYCVYYSLFCLSLLVGAATNEKEEQSIFLLEQSLGTLVLGTKLWFLIWQQHRIVDLLNRVCVHWIRQDDAYNLFEEKRTAFIKLMLVFIVTVTFSGIAGCWILPFLGSENSLFLEIGFPLDYKTNGIAFWMAVVFIFTEVTLTIVILLFSVIIWYLLLNCSLRYEMLGSDLKNMGRMDERLSGKTTKNQHPTSFNKDLKSSIIAHVHLTKLTNELDSFFSNIFFTQYGTSGLCICGSTYCLAFDIADNSLERLLHIVLFSYFVADLFMITYYGNEIMLSSDSLSYNLFESDWYNQPQWTKKNIIIFGEYLKQPHEILIGKLYPLTLETFKRILNSAYSMFNILKSFKSQNCC